MQTSNHRSQSERTIKLPKIPTRIGPTTYISPPRTFKHNLDPPKSIHTTIKSIDEAIPYPSTVFLDQLIQKYTANSNSDYIDLANKVQRTKPLIFLWSLKKTYGHLPGGRVGGTMTSIGNNIYLFGGQCGDRLNEIKILNYETLHWDTLNAVKDMETPEPRDGHTTVAYKSYLVVYGGAGAFNSILHTRTCSPLLHFLDTQSLHWKIYKPAGRSPDPRRNHGAALIGCTMIIYGGISNENNILGDLQGVNLENMQWITPKISKDSVRPGNRYSFTMTAVYHPAMFKNYTSEIFNLPVIYDEDFTRKNCGIYIFGGMNDSNKVLNDLYLLQPIKKFSRTDKNLLKIIKVDAIGKTPIARFGHSMALCGKFLVIVGGRNDSLYAGSHQSSVSEIAALNITNWRWEILDIVGVVPNSCWGAASVSLGSKLLCFGGMSLNSFASNELWTMETNQDSVEGFETKKKENAIRIVIKRTTKFGPFLGMQ